MSVAIKVYKERRELEVWKDDILLNTFRIGLSFAPKGAKRREGDGRVPEGTYYICTRNLESKFTLFLGLSYPNLEDAKIGLQEKIIDQSEYEEIKQSIEEGKRPNWETGLGGQIGIHGKGSAYDWTAGCISLDDDDIQAVWDLTEMNTPVEIYP